MDQVEKNNTIETIQNLGPNYKVEFNIFVKKEGHSLNVFHFTANDNACCNVGDRIPFVYIVNAEKKALQGDRIETPQFIIENTKVILAIPRHIPPINPDRPIF